MAMATTIGLRTISIHNEAYPWRPATRSLAIATKAQATTSFKVTLRTPQGERILEISDDEYIVDAAEKAGVELPVSCRSGACSSCAARIVSGNVDQSNQSFLDEDQVSQGFVLTCVAYPLSDVVLETHQEASLYA